MLCSLFKNRYKGKYDNFTLLYHPETGLYTEKTKNTIVSQKEINEEIDVKKMFE